MINKQAIGKVLQDKRKALGISTYRLEKISTLNRSQIAGIEQGTTNYTIDSLSEYCRHIGINNIIFSK